MTEDSDRRKLLALLESRRVAEVLLDTVPDVVFFVKDEGGRYVVLNQTLVSRCGYTRKEEILGKTAADVFPGPRGARYLEQDLYVIRTANSITDKLELHLYASGVSGWCLTNKLPLSGPDGNVIGMAGISRDVHVLTDEGRHYEELAEVIEHIQTNYGSSLRVADLARMASVSVYQLEQRIKKLFGVTVGQLISKTRIKAASRLLAETSTPVVAVAMECGYCDQSAFARQFKATTALTPSEYRRTMRSV